jgi:hypothetical protein
MSMRVGGIDGAGFSDPSNLFEEDYQQMLLHRQHSGKHERSSCENEEMEEQESLLSGGIKEAHHNVANCLDMDMIDMGGRSSGANNSLQVDAHDELMHQHEDRSKFDGEQLQILTHSKSENPLNGADTQQNQG